MQNKGSDNSLLEKIYALQKESAVSDEVIKKDVALVQERVTSVTQDVTELKERMSKQDDILSRLVDQSYQSKTDKAELKKTIRNTIIQVTVSIIFGVVLGYVFSKLGIKVPAN